MQRIIFTDDITVLRPCHCFVCCLQQMSDLKYPHIQASAIDSDDMNTLVATIFWEYLFGRPPDNVTLITQAANDWRREIAARGGKNLGKRS